MYAHKSCYTQIHGQITYNGFRGKGNGGETESRVGGKGEGSASGGEGRGRVDYIGKRCTVMLKDRD